MLPAARCIYLACCIYGVLRVAFDGNGGLFCVEIGNYFTLRLTDVKDSVLIKTLPWHMCFFYAM